MLCGSFSRMPKIPQSVICRVTPVPGSSFFSRPELGRNYVRFCFCKKPETLKAAGERLADLPKHLKNRK